MSCPKHIPCNAQQAVRLRQEQPTTYGAAVARFGKSMKTWVASGFKTVSRTVHAARLAKCATCAHHVNHFCEKCSCLVLAKTKLPHESCPLSKW